MTELDATDPNVPEPTTSGAELPADLTPADLTPADLTAVDAVARIHALLDFLADADLSRCSDAEIVEVAEAQERAGRRVTAVANRSLIEISNRNLTRELGYRSMTSFMSRRLRITDTTRRKNQLAMLGQQQSPTGEVLPPRCPTLASAHLAGEVGSGHISAVLEVIDKIPAATPHDVQVSAEATLGDYAREFAPADITTLGTRLLAHIDPDGQFTEDNDRARRRNLWTNKADAQQMSKLTGHLDPTTRAMFDVVIAAWAAAGLNNPDDEQSPSGSPEDADPDALAAAAERDNRSQAQRNHDALHALLKAVLEGGLLGKTHRGLPVQVIITIAEADLRAQTGFATTASGALLPIKDAIELAAQSQQYLAVFAEHHAVPLYLGRAARLASLGQRLASMASPGGDRCSAPGCDQPAIIVEMHHADADWANGGLTDIDNLGPACPKHNRMVSDRPGDFTTRVIREGPDAGRIAWRLNTHPRQRPNPEQINRLPDVVPTFHRYLRAIRTDIYRRPPDTRPANSRPPDNRYRTRPPWTADENSRHQRLLQAGFILYQPA